jgi:phage-related minor tail protein
LLLLPVQFVNWLLIVCILSGAVTYGITSSKDQNVKFSANANHGATKAMHVMRTNMLSVLTGNDCEWRVVVVVVVVVIR